MMTLSQNCKQLIQKPAFRYFIIFVIIVAGVQIGLESYPFIVEPYQAAFYYLDLIILTIFVVEIGIKMFAEMPKPWRYFSDGWNVFDFIIVAVCFLPIGAKFMAVARLLRIFRVLRLLTAFPQLRLIVGGLFKSIPSMGYIFILLMLHFYIYANIGTALFAQNDPFHFKDLHTAMLTLFRVITLEDWTDIMYANIYGCDQISYEGSAACNDPNPAPLAAIIYFVSFVFTGAMIVLDLFIGVIMTSMEDAKQETTVNRLIEKQVDEKLSPREEIVLLEHQLLRLTREIGALNNRICVLLEKGELRRAHEAAQLVNGQNYSEQRLSDIAET